MNTKPQTKRVNIKEADYHQLLAHARNTLGIPFTKNPDKMTLVAEVGKVTVPDNDGERFVDLPLEAGAIVHEDTLSPELAAEMGVKPREILDMTQLKSNAGGSKFDPTVHLIIGEQDEAGGAENVPVSVNGYVMAIPRGVDVKIPYRYYEALVNAVQDIGSQDNMPTPTMPTEVKWRKVRRYPFTVLALPSDDDVRAWRAKIDHLEAA